MYFRDLYGEPLVEILEIWKKVKLLQGWVLNPRVA